MSSTSQETAKVGCAHKGLPYTSSPLLGPPAHPVVRAGRFCESDWVGGGGDKWGRGESKPLTGGGSKRRARKN